MNDQFCCAMNAEAEENLRGELARAIYLIIEDELIAVVVARDLSRELERQRRKGILAEAEKSRKARLEAEKDEAARSETARVLALEDVEKTEFLKDQAELEH